MSGVVRPAPGFKGTWVQPSERQGCWTYWEASPLISKDNSNTTEFQSGPGLGQTVWLVANFERCRQEGRSFETQKALITIRKQDHIQIRRVCSSEISSRVTGQATPRRHLHVCDAQRTSMTKLRATGPNGAVTARAATREDATSLVVRGRQSKATNPPVTCYQGRTG